MSQSSLHDSVQQLIREKEASGELVREAGIAVAVVQGGSSVFEGTFGLRDRLNRLSVTPRTVFEASSVTKAMTSAAFLMAQADRQLDLDAPINSPVERLALRDPEVSGRLSIADMLSHRTGLPSHDMLWYLSSSGIEALLPRLRFLDPLPYGFRNSFVYSNLVYAAAGQVFGNMVGETWQSYVERSILRPVEMSRSFVGSTEVPRDEEIALPYLGITPVDRKSLSGLAAAGSLRTTLEDLARWVAFVLRDVRLRRMFEPQIAIQDANPLLFLGTDWVKERSSYGYGWFLGSYGGRKVAFHPGFIDGFSSLVLVLPELDTGFVALTNVNLSPVPGLLIERMLSTMLGSEQRPPVKKLGGSPDGGGAPAKEDVEVAPESVLAGIYEDPAYGRLDVALTGETALSIRYNGHQWPLRFISDREADFGVTAFGLPFSFRASFDSRRGEPRKVSIPFALDPRVRAQEFVRV